MRATLKLFLTFTMFIAALPLAAQSGVIRSLSSIDVGDSTASIRSSLTMMYITSEDCPYSDCVLGLTGIHEIKSSTGATVRDYSFNVPNTYRGSLLYAGAQNQCYFTHGAASEIYYNPPWGATGPYIITSDEETSGTECVPQFVYTCMPGESECSSTPILISLRGDYHLTSALNGVRFDINADGVPDRAAWTAPGAALAFLAMDRNGNGVIDDGSELFGNHTPMSSGQSAANGWDALVELDDSGDGVVAEEDSAWSELLLWTDADHDGVSTDGELMSVASSPIRGISVDYRVSGRRDPYGNLFRYEGSLLLDHARRSCYDVVLTTAQ